VAKKRAGMDRFSGRRRPGAIHEFRSPSARGQRESARKGFPNANEVRNRAAVFASKPASGASEAGVDFIDDQKRVELIAKFSQARKEAGGGIRMPPRA
jgi:hypothetical protein